MNFIQKIIATVPTIACAMAMNGGKDCKPSEGKAYTIPQLDLSQCPDTTLVPEIKNLYDSAVVDDSRKYVAHPDSILLNNGQILTFYPWGHGRGAIQSKISHNGGLSWEEGLNNTPSSWEHSQETPTVYRLNFADGKTDDKLILFSGNPKWPAMRGCTGGFNYSVSCDEGKSWSQFELLFDKKDKENGLADTVVAMASVTHLKENGAFVDKWMCFFHDRKFHNYKTILTFDKNGKACFSIPECYFSKYRSYEKQTHMCEVEVVRSENGTGDQLCLISRSNSKKNNTLLSFSDDEGVTWSCPKEAPAALNGERHKAEYTKDGRLFITFRSIERSKERIKKYADDGVSKVRGWYSEGWVAWVGTYQDLVEGSEGQYRIKLAHTYLPDQVKPERSANADTGYCGNVVLDDGTIVTCTYGCFDPNKTYDGKGGKKVYKTSIVSKRIDLTVADKLVEKLGVTF